MSEPLHIENIGYTAYNNPKRAIRSGEEFEGIIPAPDWRVRIVKRDADVEQVVGEMQKLIRESAWQTKELSKRLLGKDIYTTCGNVWRFLFSHIKYKEDDKGKEQLRMPALSWYIRRIRGIDCDDFSIYAGTILFNLKIPFYLRIARYEKKTYFQHVYVIVPQTQRKYITIDAVLDEYDAEKETAETKDFLVMNTNNLNGIEVSVLGGIEEDTVNEVAGILFGVDFGEVEELEGLGQEPDEDVVLGAIYKHLVRTRNAVRRFPQIVRSVEDPETFAGMLEYGIKYWNTDKQEMALGILEEKEEEINRMNGLENMPDGYEETTVFYGLEGLGGVSALGKAKTKKTFFKSVKQAVQKVKQSKAVQKVKQNKIVQKVAKSKVVQKAKQAGQKIFKKVVQSNLVSVAARTGMLLAMKTNLLKIAESLKWGYLTEPEARDAGMDMTEWANARTQLKKAESIFVDKLKGSAEKFKQAILKGRAGGLNGLTQDLGAVTAAAASASIAAAMPFIKKILEFAKAINLQKLIGKVKANRLMKKNKKAETMPEVSEDSPSAMPDENTSEAPSADENQNTQQDSVEQTKDPATNEVADNNETTNTETVDKADTNTDATENRSGDSASPSKTNAETNSEGTESKENAGENEVENKTENSNLPVTSNARNLTVSAAEGTFITKFTDWVKENKLITGLAIGGLILTFSSGARKAIGLGKAPRNNKKRKGKNKNNPPQIAGTGKNKPKTVKKDKRKGKNGGGGSRQIRL